MPTEAQQQEFEKGIDKLRRLPKRIEPSDIARIGQSVGLSAHETLLRIEQYAGYGGPGVGQTFEALCTFISAVCRPADRVLEYTTTLSLLTAGLINGTDRRP